MTLEEAGAAKMSGKKNICLSCAHSKVCRFNDGELSEYCNQYLAISALRPVSRERVEKVWEKCQHSRVCGTCKVCVSGRYQQANFCAACGAPLTDEAVEMVMERMEALHEKT